MSSTGDFVSTGRLPDQDRVRSLVAEAYERFRRDGGARVGPSTRRSRACRAISSASAWPATDGAVYARRRRRGPVHDHERLQAVRLRAGLPGARAPRRPARSSASTAPGSRSTRSMADRAEHRRAHQPDGQPGRDRDDQPRAGRDAEERWRLHAATGCRGSPAATLALDEEVYASALGDQRPQPGIARLLQSYGRPLLRPAEATDLYTRQCSLNVTAQRPRGDGRDPRRRRRQPAHRRAGRRRRDLPPRAGGDGDRRALRDLRRLALRDRAAGQERHRRRHRHRLARQGRARHLRAAARRRRQQRPGPARRRGTLARGLGLYLFASAPEDVD